MRTLRRRSLLLTAALTLIAATPAATGIANAESTTYRHIWAATAPAYQRLPADAPIDVNSVAIVQNIKRYGIEQYGVPARDLPSMNLALRQFSNPLWVARNSDPSYDIQFSDCQNKRYLPSEFQNLKGVRIPDDAKQSAGTDGQMVIINADTGRYVDLWQAFKAEGKWHACWGGSIANSHESDGIFPVPSGVSASGLALEPYTVKVAELRAGRIDHAIGIHLPPQVLDRYVSKPATRTDGNRPRSDNTISEGQLLRLPADLDLDALNLHPVARIIAKAVQEHGFMVADGSIGINISLENASTFATDPYPELLGKADTYNAMWGGRNWQYGAFPFDKLQAVERDYIPAAQSIEITDQRETSFGFKAKGAPTGARLVVTWWREGEGQRTSVKHMDWWSGRQIGYRNAQARLVDSAGRTLATSDIIRGS